MPENYMDMYRYSLKNNNKLAICVTTTQVEKQNAILCGPTGNICITVTGA